MIRELSWQNLTPELIIDTEYSQLVCGEHICIALSQERHCIGYKEFGAMEFIPCPDKKEILPGKDPQCDFCKQRDISFTAKTGYGLSKQAGELLSSDHVVYLAYFSNETIKVGVALWNRREVRVSEQGAIACLFIAKGNGTMARNFERRVHTSTGFTEWVRLETKLKGLGKEPNKERARTSLEEAYIKVRNITPSAILLSEPEFIYLFPRYAIQESVFNSDMALAQELCGGANVCDRLVGVYGKVLLFGIASSTYAINSLLLCGFDVQSNISKCPQGATSGVTMKHIAVDHQQSLFD
jgi:hypothetical protein